MDTRPCGSAGQSVSSHLPVVRSSGDAHSPGLGQRDHLCCVPPTLYRVQKAISIILFQLSLLSFVHVYFHVYFIFVLFRYGLS